MTYTYNDLADGLDAPLIPGECIPPGYVQHWDELEGEYVITKKHGDVSPQKGRLIHRHRVH